LSEAIEGKKLRLNQETSAELTEFQMNEFVTSDEETDTNITDL